MSDIEATLAGRGADSRFAAREQVIELHESGRSSGVNDRSGPGDVLSRRRLFDLDFVDAPSLEPVLSALLQRHRADDESLMDTVLTPNVDIMVHLTREGAEQSVEWRMFQHSQYCLPDGQPIILASRLLGRPLAARLTGSGLFAMLWPRLVAERRSVFMVASSDLIVERLGREYGDLRSTVAPMFDADDEETIEQLAGTVIASATEQPVDYVIVGIGNPKDARIAESILRLWPLELGRPPTILGLGGSASMYVGITKRAPSWVQRIGMEWFYRFLQEPRRLFRRYFIHDVAFVKLIWRQWRADRRGGSNTASGKDRSMSARKGSGSGMTNDASVSVVMPVGRVDPELSEQIAALAAQTYRGSWELVVSLNAVDREQRTALEASLEPYADSLAVRIVDSSDHRSASHARNVGARAADGELLLFCDADDIADCQWIEQLSAALEFYGAVGGFLDEELLSVPGQEHWRPPATPGDLPTFLGHPFLVSANMGVIRSNFEAVGGFDTGLVRGEDIAFSWDLLERGVELGYCAEAVMYYRHRRGLSAMMQQHYLYGRGFSQILARRGTPGTDKGATGLSALKPNGQAVARKSFPYFLRRGSIAAGRVVGLVEERVLRHQGSR